MFMITVGRYAIVHEQYTGPTFTPSGCIQLSQFGNCILVVVLKPPCPDGCRDSPLGCILAELHTGFPLFPGENEVEQLACIMEVLDLPPEELIIHATRRRLFFGEWVLWV